MTCSESNYRASIRKCDADVFTSRAATTNRWLINPPVGMSTKSDAINALFEPFRPKNRVIYYAQLIEVKAAYDRGGGRLHREHNAEAEMASISRRLFLKVGGGVAASVAIGLPKLTQAATPKPTAEGRVNLPYQMQALSKAQKLQVNTPVLFSYPDAASPCALIKMGTPVPGGVGPDRDIVAYSTLCTHMGCPVAYDPGQKVFKCPCHFSIFDPENIGQMVSGQATENLPSIVLEYNPNDDSVRAVAVEGLIYGRQSNLL